MVFCKDDQRHNFWFVFFTNYQDFDNLYILNKNLKIFVFFSVKEERDTFQGQAKNQAFSSERKCFEPCDQSAASFGRQQISWLNMFPPMVHLFPHTVQESCSLSQSRFWNRRSKQWHVGGKVMFRGSTGVSGHLQRGHNCCGSARKMMQHQL